ncbi:MAG: helix-turn-helix domain-containing protein [Hyphomicrobiales bacterium]
MGIQILRTEDGDELIVLSRRDYDALLARAGDEDAEDRMTLIVAAEARAEAPLPESVSAAIFAGDSCLKALRSWRGLTQAELAKRSGINQGYISEIENRSKTGTAETLSKLAEVLDVPAGWLG